MIFLGKKEIESIFIGKNPVAQIYIGAKLVWESIKSCFGAGFWKNEAPWSNIEGWRN